MKSRSLSPLLFVALLIGSAATGLRPCAGQTPPASSDERLQWWRDARFGLFIHWGPVSLKGTEISWSRSGPRLGCPDQSPGAIPREEYDALYKSFNPTAFDAREWARIAKAAGTRYVVLTAKHCDGFCLWPTKTIDYHIGRTPYGRDVCGALATALHEAGLRVGWYYSPLDWYDPDCRTGRNAVYVKRMQAQLSELLGDYGRIDLLWFDTDGGPSPWDQAATYALVRKLQPAIVVNNRLDMGSFSDYDAQKVRPGADYYTPEQRVGGYDERTPWETCMTLGTQWSWKPDDAIKSVAETVAILVRCAGGDGNLLLDVGPMPSGAIEPRQVAVLEGVGRWLGRCGESIYGTRGGPFRPGRYGASTRRGKTIFVHWLRATGERLLLPAIAAKVTGARLLTADAAGGADGGAVAFRQSETSVELSVPAAGRSPIDTVVALDLDRDALALPAVDVPGVRSLTTGATATASNVYRKEAAYGADKAVDGDDETRWATDVGTAQAWLELDLGRPTRFDQAALAEAYPGRVQQFDLEWLDGSEWRSFAGGTTIGECWTRRFAPVTARKVRLNVHRASDGPTIFAFDLFDVEG